MGPARVLRHDFIITIASFEHYLRQQSLSSKFLSTSKRLRKDSSINSRSHPPRHNPTFTPPSKALRITHPRNVDPQRSSAEGKRPAPKKDLRQHTCFFMKPSDQKRRLTTPQLLQEIETRAMASQQQIGLTKAQMTAKQRDIRMLQLTSKELSDLPSATPIYEGVGKM